MLRRAELVREMHLNRVHFIPTLELQDDATVEKIYQEWKERDKPIGVNIYHESGKQIKMRQRKKKRKV